MTTEPMTPEKLAEIKRRFLRRTGPCVVSVLRIDSGGYVSASRHVSDVITYEFSQEVRDAIGELVDEVERLKKDLSLALHENRRLGEAEREKYVAFEQRAGALKDRDQALAQLRCIQKKRNTAAQTIRKMRARIERLRIENAKLHAGICDGKNAEYEELVRLQSERDAWMSDRAELEAHRQRAHSEVARLRKEAAEMWPNHHAAFNKTGCWWSAVSIEGCSDCGQRNPYIEDTRD